MDKKGLYMYCGQNVYSSNPIQKTVRWFQVGNNFNTKKEVKKVNKIPYFETKVVKVKKAECKHNTLKKIAITPYYATYQCVECGLYFYPPIKDYKHKKIIEKQSKGNWVNGECIDKIKFPVPCSYIHGTEKMGILFKLGNSFYVVNIDEQGDYNKYFLSYDLKHLIEDFNIHILKGKIIIFEEEEK